MHFDCWKDWTKIAYMRRLNELKASDVVVLSISECSRVDLHRLTEFPLERAVTIMAGINRSNLSGKPSSEALQKIKEKFGLNSPFFMSVGGLDGHKGFVATAQAYAALRSSKEFQFVVVGSFNDPYKEHYRKLFEANKIPGVVFTGYLSREEMACLYALSSGLVFPSHYEGFGFPVLEAMAHGCPVITTNVSSLPEVAGDAAILVGLDDARGIENAMRRLLDESGLRAQMSARGLQQAAKFSWEQSAQKTIQVWLELLGEEVSASKSDVGSVGVRS
ncbi:MAG: glycosyltransferase family 4 protein [Deltaproteobacteria bacterium]|nr:glycosyltransferase family 4 protein [Deltaproteobacteria bacterium]